MKMNRTRLNVAIATLFTAGSALSAAALAQQDAAPATTDDSAAVAKKPARSDQIQSVVVTAQKRKEDVNKVPISVSVVSGEDLAAKHIAGLEDVTRSVPNISFSGGTQGNGPGLSNIEMRGISSSAGSGTVGIYMDDVSMTTRNLYSLGSPEPKFFDVDRIEVLRGPQGTLYGASSMGGTLKVIMNQPDLTHSTNFETAELSSTSKGGINYTVNSVLNVPLVPGEMALRIGLESSHTSGFITQVNPDTLATVRTKTNKEDDAVLRMALKWVVNRNLTLTPSVFYQQIKTADLGTEYPASQTTGAPLPPYTISKPFLEPGNDKLLVPSLTVNYDLGGADLISVTSYYKRTFDRLQDGTQANSAFIGSSFIQPGAPDGLAAALTVMPGYVYLNNDVRQFSQEFRLASKSYDPKTGNNALTWLGGAYFSNLHTTVNDNEPIPGINALFASYGVRTDDPAIVSGTFPGAFANDSAYFSARHYRTTQKALFGEVSYHFTPDLSATAGLRDLYATDSLAREGSNYFTAVAGPTIQLPHPVDTHALTPKFAMSWNVGPNDMVYANAAKGFRLGSQNRDIPLSLCGAELAGMGLSQAPASFGPDSLWSYEVGNKSRFLNNRLSINASAFYITWNNIQVDRALNCTFDYETNAGKARSTGIELEVKGKPTRDLTLGMSAGYTDAYLIDANQALGSLPGQKVPGVPKFNATLDGEYRYTITDTTDGFARLAAHWIGSSYGTPHVGDSDYTRPAYATVDASVGANFERWQLSLFAKNLANNNKVIQRPSVQFFEENYRLPPRTIGVNVSGSL